MLRLLTTVVAVLSLSSQAFAQEPDFDSQALELAKTVAKRAVTNVRRSTALGPFVAVAPESIDGDYDVLLTGGIGLYKFKRPIIMNSDQLVGILKDRAKSKLIDRVKAFRATGAQPTQNDLETLAAEVWADVKSEFLLGSRPKIFEKPSFALRLEVGRSADHADWEVRASAAVGMGPVYISPGAALAFLDNLVFFVPVEVSVPLALGSGVRTTVVDVFARVNFATHGRDENSDRLMFGARLLFDIL